jgi:predicted ATP-grasp superfamily ATP-dependent carboligase
MAIKSSVLVVGNYRPSLGVLRSLGRAGYRIIVGRDPEFSFVERSRYCAETWSHPSMGDPEPFLAALVDFLRTRPDISLVFPVQQGAVVLLARHADRLPASVTLVNVPQSIVETCLDKARMFAVAESSGVPVETFATAGSLVDLSDVVDGIGLPVIIRPIGSGPERLPGGKKALICPDRATMEKELQSWPVKHRQLLVQRFSPGPRHNVYFAASAGRILGRVEIVVLRTDRPDDTGFAVEGISVAPDPALDRYLVALVKALEYTGVGCVQFVRREAGDFHFLELNPRLGANYLIAERCGLDLARLACDIATGDIGSGFEPILGYPTGIRYAWTLGDFLGLGQARAQREISVLDTCRWAVRAVYCGITADVHLTWSAHDPKPTLYLYALNAPFGLDKLLVRGDSERA